MVRGRSRLASHDEMFTQNWHFHLHAAFGSSNCWAAAFLNPISGLTNSCLVGWKNKKKPMISDSSRVIQSCTPFLSKEVVQQETQKGTTESLPLWIFRGFVLGMLPTGETIDSLSTQQPRPWHMQPLHCYNWCCQDSRAWNVRNRWFSLFFGCFSLRVVNVWFTMYVIFAYKLP